MPRPVGIDLGTTNSVVAVLEAGEPQVIPNAEGSRTTPSVVGFSKTGEILVGELAKRQAISNPDRTIRSIKREMGTSWTQEIDGKNWTPQEISAQILTKLKRDAEAYLGDTVTQAVITVPAYFDDAQRQATKEAGQIAGLEVLRIINEPTAASLAYGLDKQGSDQTILVFDLGGGTFDVSLLEIGEGVFEVKATAGNTKLGGDDWDQKVIDWIVKEFQNAHGVDLSKDRIAMQRLKDAAEKAKIELSQVSQTSINLPFITEGPLHLDMSLSRSEFERMTEDLVQQLEGPFNQAVKDWGQDVSAIDHVILVGGATRMPMVQELVKRLTGGKEPHKGVNPDEVVSVGAAIQAGVLKGEGKEVLFLEVTFDIDANGIVNVSAKDRATGKEQAMTITGGTALAKEEIDRMVQEAEQFAEEDAKRREAEDKAQVEKDIAVVKDALKGDDTDAIRSATDALMQSFQRVGEAVYQQAQAQQQEQAAGGGGAGSAQPGGEDVVEGEVVDEGGAS